MRGVDATWPEVASELRHSIGVWPILIDDSTQVRHSVPERTLALRGRGWPLGEADIVISLRASGTGTEVEIDEDVAAGPGRFLPKPVRDLLIGWRNVETLRRLALIAEGRETTSLTTGHLPATPGGSR